MIVTSAKARGYFCAIAVSILWGLSYIGSDRAMAAGLETFSLVAVRFSVTVVTLLLLAPLCRVSLRVRAKDLLPLLVTAVTGVTLYYYCELKGLQCTSPSVASLIVATIPVFSLLTAVLLRRKRPSPLMWIGVAASLVGVYLLVFTDVGENSVRGFLLLLGGCLCWVIYLEITDRLLVRYSSLTVSFWQSLLALITTLPLAATESVPWRSIPVDAWLWAGVFLGLICSGLCYLMNNYSIAVLSPQMNAAFLNLSPVATAAGGYLILHETVTPSQLTGGVVILASLFLISLGDRQKPRRAKS